MATFICAVFLSLFALSYADGDNAAWGYCGQDSDHYLVPGLMGHDWMDGYALCGGDAQSPIDIPSGTPNCVTTDGRPGPFTFTNYDLTTASWDITNNGHTVTVKLADDDTSAAMEVSGGDLGASYTFVQFHVHWGADDTMGSEHTINGVAYPMELHLVHYRSDFDDISAALASGEPDALAVLGIMFSIDADTNSVLAEKLISVAAGIETADSSNHVAFDMGTVTLNELLPATDDYFRYMGSLTTPTCNEAVKWTLFNSPVMVTSEQMASIRSSFKYGDGETNTMNYRPIMKRNGRAVTASFGAYTAEASCSDTDNPMYVAPVCDGASATHASIMLAAIVSLVAVFFY